MRLLVVAVVVAQSAPSRAQMGAADGVDAFLRGEYRRAVVILKPLVETPWRPDQAAEFFMGVAYENGLGVPADPIHACALFMRASIDLGTSLGVAAMELVRARQRTLQREAFEECNWRASVGFEDRFEPVTFALAQEHSISLDLKGATIAYQGVEKRVAMPLAFGRPRFVAIRHTELATGDRLSTRRHFVDIFKWIPQKQPGTWTLDWALVEVVRDELIAVTSQQLLTTTGQEPPARDSLDLDTLVHLAVNADGDPEWSVCRARHAAACLPFRSARMKITTE